MFPDYLFLMTMFIPTLFSIEQKLNFSLLTPVIESMVMTTKLNPNVEPTIIATLSFRVCYLTVTHQELPLILT